MITLTYENYIYVGRRYIYKAECETYTKIVLINRALDLLNYT